MDLFYPAIIIVKEVNLLKYLDEFLQVFGDVTVSQLIVVILAFVFLFLVYKEIRKYVTVKVEEHHSRIEKEKQQEKKINEAWNETQKYPEYRKQSLKIQELLEDEIQEIRNGLQAMMKRFEEIEEQNKKRECSKLRDMLLQNYRYYTNKERNPSQTWTRMEAEAFWELFRDYEEAGGNGYMHTVVQPEMERLMVVEVGEK